jgi:hypothetical protein
MEGFRQLLSEVVREACRNLAVQVSERDIALAWGNEGFIPADATAHRFRLCPPDPYDYYDDHYDYAYTEHRRRSTFDEYERLVDWGDTRQATRALRALSSMARRVSEDQLDRLRSLIKSDGLLLMPDGQIVAIGGSLGVPSIAYSDLADPTMIEESLTRVRRALPDDPALAIGSAKELVEATAKVVLLAKGVAHGKNDDLPQAGEVGSRGAPRDRIPAARPARHEKDRVWAQYSCPGHCRTA